MNASLLCSIDDCEGAQWLIGTPGTCNTTGVCDCPAGYSGSFILTASNDCHMSETFKLTLNLITFTFAVSALLGSLAALRKVGKEISQIYTPRIVPLLLRSPSRDEDPVTVVRPSQRGVLKRKLLVVRNILLFVSFSSCEVYRSAILLRNADAFAVDIPVHVILVYGVGISSSTTSMFLFLYIYTSSLPKSGQLAAVLGINHDESRYQKLINWVFKYNTLFCLALIAVFGALHAAKLSPWYIRNYVVLEIVMQTIIAIDVNMVTWFVYYMNVPLFQKIIAESCQHKSVSKLKTAVFRCRILVASGLASILSFVSCCVLSSMDSRHNFMLFTVIAVNEQMLILLGSYLLGWDFVTVIKCEPTEKNYQKTRSAASSVPA